MAVSRKRPKRRRLRRRFGLSVFLLLTMPASVGYQDLAALIARQPGPGERWRQHVLASPFGTIHAATFSFPRPVGSAIPDPLGFRTVNLDPRSLDVTGSLGDMPMTPALEPRPTVVFPRVDRTNKGDRLTPAALTPASIQGPTLQPAAAESFDSAPRNELDDPALMPSANADVEALSADMADDPAQEDMPPAVTLAEENAEPVSGMDLEFAIRNVAPDFMALRDAPRSPDGELLTDDEPIGPDGSDEPYSLAYLEPESATMHMARVYFGAEAMGPTDEALQPWGDGEAPTLMLHPPANAEVKRAAVRPALDGRDDLKSDDAAAGAAASGESVAPKGEVTGADKRPVTPAERLKLSGAVRAKHERCLANAVYFEARGESERGQMAVAQVVLNRAFSGYYPTNICGVVYQNAHRHLACQFTFACDNVRDVVTEPQAWETAKRIARDSLDGKIWLPEIGKATHYHATYVRPWWVRTMTKHQKLGIHIFYRPTRWGNGADAPIWGPTASVTERSAVAAAKM